MTRRYVAVTVFCVILGGIPLWAQSPHPCDVVQPTSYTLTLNESIRIGFCHSGKDPGGSPVTEFQVVLATGPVSLGVPTIIGGANAGGLFYYETAAFPATVAGSFTLRAVSIGGTSLPSSPITVTFGPPLAPVGGRILK